MIVLFICTGNYYRSRFAELLFNELASRAGLEWRAESRGTAAYASSDIGPLARETVRALEARGFPVPGTVRFPLQLQKQDLARANRIIALNDEEHRAYLESRFRQWADRIEYWRIPDLDVAPADVALPEVERHIKELLGSLDS